MPRKAGPGNPNWKKGMPSPNPAGKPVGAKDKAWATLQFWFDKLNEVAECLTPEKKAEAILEVIKLLVPRRTLPPESPGDSKENADILLKEIQRAEGLIAQSRSGAPMLESGTAKIQVSPDPVGVSGSVGSVQG